MKSKKKSIILNGDWGGDDMVATASLLGHREQFEILGISTVFGNVSQPYATNNALDFLHWMQADDIPVAMGADIPLDGKRPFGDDAYGTDGAGGVKFRKSPRHAFHVDLPTIQMQWLEKAKYPVTLIETGPLTNLALLNRAYPEAKKLIEEVIWMGGARDPRGAKGKQVFVGDQQRTGNITITSEFNAYQDPMAANEVMQSGMNVTVMPLDATQNLVLTPSRQRRLESLGAHHGPKFLQMMMAVAELDKAKYGVDGPFPHDVHTVLYAAKPHRYTTEKMPALRFIESVPQEDIPNDVRGKVVTDTPVPNVTWVTGIKNRGRVFNDLENSLNRATGLYFDA